MPHERQRTGQAGEAAAARYLEARGLRIVARNWRCRHGELDLVALDGEAVAFIEVKTRQGDRYGPAAAAVDLRKQARLSRLARAFVHERGWHDRACRFDVITVTRAGSDPASEWQIDWIQDAFRA